MKKRTFFYLLLLLLSSCSTTENEPEDRLEGYFASDPLIGFSKYEEQIQYLRPIDTLFRTDTLVLVVSEFNRSDLKPCPAKGYELQFIIESQGGDKEYYTLSDNSAWILHSDNITPYIKFLPFVFRNPVKNNQIFEINNAGDVIVATYRSYWHGHVVKDTLIYKKEE